MAYITPRTLITQEFTQSAASADQPLASLIIGPQYALFRYDEVDEKALTKLANSDAVSGNAYKSGADTTYNFPNRPAGANVDASYTKVFIEQANVKYFPNTILGSASAVATHVAIPNSASYFTNKLKSSALTFKTANGSARSSVFSQRDVQVGDYVELTNGSIVQRTKIRGLSASTVAASVGATSADVSNTPAHVQALTTAPTWVGSGSAPSGRVTIVNDTTAYVGYNNLAVLQDTYTITVTTGGDLSTVRFGITSANNVFAAKTGVALITVSGDLDILWIDNAGSQAVRCDFTGSTSFLVGDSWTVTVTAATTAITPTANSTYTGTDSLSYKLTVVRGGVWYDPTANSGAGNADVCARIAISSTNTDASPTVNVQVSTAFAVGSYGTTATFSTASANGGLILGDSYYIPVTAAADGVVNVIQTQDDLPAAFVSATGTWTISLFLVEDFQINKLRVADGSQLNWTVNSTANTITVSAGLTTSDSSLLDGSGNLVALTVDAGGLFVTHRDLVPANTLSIGSLRSHTDVASILGTVHPDNPLAQGVYNAALNAAGVIVYFVGVATDDLAGYNGALALAKRDNKYHGVTPLTFDRTIQDSVVAHVNAMSTAENAKWRVAWLSSPLVPVGHLYTLKPNNSVWLGTVTDDPDIAGTSYSMLTVPGATFITDGVRALDQVNINFHINANNEVIHDTYIVDSVITETTLRFTTALSAPINVGTKVTIDRPYTKDEQVTALSHVAGDYNNRRVRVVFPDTVKNGNITQNGYFVAAACAGLRSGVVPHQGLTNSEVLGFTDLSKCVVDFSEDQLNVLAEQGVWLVTQTTVGATAYVRHQLTTDESSLNTSEDSPTCNIDSLSYALQDVLSPYIGKYNRNTKSIMFIRNDIIDEMTFRQTETYTVRAGNQIISYDIVTLEPSVLFKDRLNIVIAVEVPYPYNFINLTIIV